MKWRRALIKMPCGCLKSTKPGYFELNVEVLMQTKVSYRNLSLAFDKLRLTDSTGLARACRGVQAD